MKHSVFTELNSWAQKPNRKPLLLQGVRQVGKTYAIKAFAKERYENLIYLNFETEPQFASLFAESLEPQTLIRKLELATNQTITPRSSLLFFDEVHECGRALTSLKYFREGAADRHIIAAGSLLGVSLAVNVSFPVGHVQFLNLWPLTFVEFLSARGLQSLADFILNIEIGEQIDELIHHKLLSAFHEYCFVGGVPEVVQSYVNAEDLDVVRDLQRAILRAYQCDFSKHPDPGETLRIRKIWESLPAQLVRENRKFIFSAVAKSARARECESALQWLVDAGMILKARNVEIARAPLAASSSSEVFKIFGSDIGLVGARMQVPKSSLLDVSELFMGYRGIRSEQVVAQEIVAAGGAELYYWTSAAQAEVDFLLEVEGQVVPVEVKSGINKKAKSLRQFMKKYQPIAGYRFSLDRLLQTSQVTDLPIYLAGQLSRFIGKRINASG